MELQETVLVSEGEGEGMAVHRFAPDELVIQDAVEDVVSEYVHCDEDEDVAVETCVMALEGEEEGVAMGDIPEDGLDPDQQEDDHDDGCGDYLMISCKLTSLHWVAFRCGIVSLQFIRTLCTPSHFMCLDLYLIKCLYAFFVNSYSLMLLIWHKSSLQIAAKITLKLLNQVSVVSVLSSCVVLVASYFLHHTYPK